MGSNGFSREIAELIQNWLRDHEWKYEYNEDGECCTFLFDISINSKFTNLWYKIGVRDSWYVVVCHPPLKAPHKDRKRMRELTEMICRINFGLINGSFDMNMNNGQIIFRCFVNCDGIVPSSDIISKSILDPYAMFLKYGDEIVDVMLGQATAKDAVEKAENPKERRKKIESPQVDQSAKNNLRERLGTILMYIKGFLK